MFFKNFLLNVIGFLILKFPLKILGKQQFGIPVSIGPNGQIIQQAAQPQLFTNGNVQYSVIPSYPTIGIDSQDGSAIIIPASPSANSANQALFTGGQQTVLAAPNGQLIRTQGLPANSVIPNMGFANLAGNVVNLGGNLVSLGNVQGGARSVQAVQLQSQYQQVPNFIQLPVSNGGAAMQAIQLQTLPGFQMVQGSQPITTTASGGGQTSADGTQTVSSTGTVSIAQQPTQQPQTIQIQPQVLEISSLANTPSKGTSDNNNGSKPPTPQTLTIQPNPVSSSPPSSSSSSSTATTQQPSQAAIPQILPASSMQMPTLVYNAATGQLIPLSQGMIVSNGQSVLMNSMPQMVSSSSTATVTSVASSQSTQPVSVLQPGQIITPQQLGLQTLQGQNLQLGTQQPGQVINGTPWLSAINNLNVGGMRNPNTIQTIQVPNMTLHNLQGLSTMQNFQGIQTFQLTPQGHLIAAGPTPIQSNLTINSQGALTLAASQAQTAQQTQPAQSLSPQMAQQYTATVQNIQPAPQQPQIINGKSLRSNHYTDQPNIGTKGVFKGRKLMVIYRKIG